jgi:hypothetical protein
LLDDLDIGYEWMLSQDLTYLTQGDELSRDADVLVDPSEKR